MYRVGMDLGSSYTKGVLVDETSQIVDYVALKTGYDFKKASQKIIDRFSLSHTIEYPVYSCGYGREQLDVPYSSKSEITALAEAVSNNYRQSVEVIDIGGQDTKYIKILENGRIDRFKLNRKCAAGTGAFLEEIAFRLSVDPAEFSGLAKQSTEQITLNSYCTVFAVSEIIGLVKHGCSLANIVQGVYQSIIKRCEEMAPLQTTLIITGGIPDKHPMLVELFKELFEDTRSPALSQFMAAYGCVLLSNNKREYPPPTQVKPFSEVQTNDCEACSHSSEFHVEIL